MKTCAEKQTQAEPLQIMASDDDVQEMNAKIEEAVTVACAVPGFGDAANEDVPQLIGRS